MGIPNTKYQIPDLGPTPLLEDVAQEATGERNAGRNRPHFSEPPTDSLTGFTLIEMIVVLAVMGVILGLVLVDFAGQRAPRDSRIAQNELVTNIRKVQSYSLFSRNVGNTKPAQYYIVKFSSATPDRYFIEAITDVNSSPKLNSMETVLLPRNIVFRSVSPFMIDRPDPLSDSVTPTCVLLAFKSPFGKAYVSDGCSIASPPDIQSGDDYDDILKFVSNTPGLSVSVDTNLVLIFLYKNVGSTKKVIVKGVTGLVCPTVTSPTCAF